MSNKPLSDSFYWSRLTSEEISELIHGGRRTAILPFGSTEQHGPHLMTGNDYLFAERLAIDLALRFNAFVLPPIPFGMADHHMGFAGTITIGSSTLIALLNDIARSVEKSGIENLILCNGHGGNYPLISDFASAWSGDLKIHHDAHARLLFQSAKPFMDEFSSAEKGAHAGLQETSIAMHTHPEYGVRSHLLEQGAMPAGDEWTAEEMKHAITHGLHTISPNGVLGDARRSTPELGRRFYESMLEMYVRFFAEQGLN
jgi:creatinine amidohydrolase